MVKRNTEQLKAAALALLVDTASDGSIAPSEHRALYDNLVDSRGVVDAAIAAGQVTLTLADGDTVVFAIATTRPSDAQYHATITATSAAPDAAALTAGPDHRDSNDGAIMGWPARNTNAWMWIWSSHVLSDIRNGGGSQNQFTDFRAPTRLMVGAVNGYLYRGNEIFFPAALNLNWRVQ